MNHQWLVSGVGRSGTSTVYKSLLKVAVKHDKSFAFFYEPYLWGEKIWSRRPEDWAGKFGVTSALNPSGLSAHLHTPLFLDRAEHSAHDTFSDNMFGKKGNVLTKIIRGPGRLEYYLKRYPELRAVHVIRNPLDCINSALGLFSFFGDEFHLSDKERFFEDFSEFDPSSLTSAELFGLWWEKMNEVSLRVAKKYPERVFVLAHEEYVRNIGSIFSKLLNFLNVPTEYAGDISFSDPAGPITKSINLHSRDVASLLDMHSRYFDQLPEICPEMDINDSDQLRTRTAEKYSGAPEGVFSPAVPWDDTPLMVRRHLINSQDMLDRKMRQVDRLRLAVDQLREKYNQQCKENDKQKDIVKAAKLNLLNQEINLKKLESEFTLLQSEYSHLEADKSKISARLNELEFILAPRLKTLLTLRPMRYVWQQRNNRASGKLDGQFNQSVDELENNDEVADESSVSSEPEHSQLALSQSTSHIRSMYEQHQVAKPLGIALFAYDRFDHLQQVLKSLEFQGALNDTTVWIDGDQGKTKKKLEIDQVERLVREFPVKAVHRNRSNFGFRKVILLAMREMMASYDRILFLEDDCFPTRHALNGFSHELDCIENSQDIFSVYGHPFLIKDEMKGHGRFQGWGWATTSEKLAPIWEQLLDCYMMTEDRYIEFTKKALNDELRARIDITPGRQPTDTLSKFFAWDETLCLLTAMKGLKHKPTTERLIFNFGAGDQSTHFTNVDYYRSPPFNMISKQDVWNYF